jgi:hypothetical protein
MEPDTTSPGASEPSPHQLDRLRLRARVAALLSAALFAGLAFAVVAASRERWSAQGDYDYSYANHLHGVFVASCALAALYLVLAGLIRGRDAFAAGAALVTGWTTRAALLLVLVGSCVPVGYVGPAIIYILFGTPILAVGGLVLFLSQPALLRWARASGGGPERRRAAWAGRLAPVGYAALCFGAYGQAVRAHASYRREDAVRALWRVHACAHRYVERHPELGFPTGDGALAEAEPGCQVRLIAGSAPFALSYAPGPRDARGRVASFETRVRQRHLWRRRHETLVTSETGVVHVAFGRDATLRDHVAPIARPVPQMYSGCLRRFRWEHGERGYPVDLLRLETEAGCATVEPRAAPNVIERDGYRFIYVPAGAPRADGLAPDYTLQARPLAYGETGVRSYFIDGRDVLRATAEPRAATADDQPAMACEFDSANPWRACVEVPDER